MDVEFLASTESAAMPYKAGKFLFQLVEKSKSFFSASISSVTKTFANSNL